MGSGRKRCPTDQVKLIAKVKLQTTADQSASLKETLARANECCNWMSEFAWESKRFQKFAIQQDCYHEARIRFDLTAQVVIRCIAKVADSYTTAFKLFRTHTAEAKKRNKKRLKEGKEEKPLPVMEPPWFRKDGSIAYDQRILRWYVEKSEVSIWSLAGRLKIPFIAGERQKEMLQSQKGESDLILCRGKFYLAAGCEVDHPTPAEVSEFLGLDLGVKNIATDSDGNNYSGSHVSNVRHRHVRLRAKLQKKGTKSAKRRLKKLSGKERRFATDTNHVISKQIVNLAKGTGRGVALEDLKGIRNRITVRRKQRYALHSWAFFQLRGFVSYKAQRIGVVERSVDARNSSRECAECGHIAKKNRPTQDKFRCLCCDSRKPADFNAALVIRSRAAVIQPNVAGCE
jgi:putative transposase